jgi:hypothetical protein
MRTELIVVYFEICSGIYLGRLEKYMKIFRAAKY